MFPFLLRSGCLPLLLFVAVCIAGEYKKTNKRVVILKDIISVAVFLTSVLPSTENQELK